MVSGAHALPSGQPVARSKRYAWKGQTTLPLPIRPSASGPFDRIPIGEGRTFDVDGLQIAVFRPRSGQVFATQASCPHANGPLADGLVGNGTVVCPFHAYRFDLATGCPEGNACAPLTTYPAGLTTDGDVVVTLGGR